MSKGDSKGTTSTVNEKVTSDRPWLSTKVKIKEQKSEKFGEWRVYQRRKTAADRRGNPCGAQISLQKSKLFNLYFLLNQTTLSLSDLL